MPTLPDRYSALVASGAIERDPAQVMLVARLQELSAHLIERQLASKSRALGWIFAKKRAAAPPVKGLYIWGKVGRGKTMLMDLFFEHVPVARKRRAHFHAFMADVHARIHATRHSQKAGEVKEGDPILPVAQALADETSLLCFDEFVVTDIADAMILGRLFTRLFALGVTLSALHYAAAETGRCAAAGGAHRFPAGEAGRRASLSCASEWYGAGGTGCSLPVAVRHCHWQGVDTGCAGPCIHSA
jgi:cell division protein ZapE